MQFEIAMLLESNFSGFFVGFESNFSGNFCWLWMSLR